MGGGPLADLRGTLNVVRRALLSVAALSWLVALALPAAAGDSTPVPSASALFSLGDQRIDESSGLAASSDGRYVYTHNDSGDSARFFKVDARGNTAAVYTLRGAKNIDWEDMATGADAAGHRILYFGDIGDNTASRKEVDVYRVAEPTGRSGDVPWVRYRFAYPDGAHDAEALLVDPRTQRIYIATKTLLGGGALYAAPATLTLGGLNILSRVRPVPSLVTSADFSPDGTRIVLLTYLAAYWADGVDGALHSFDGPLQRQDEAIAFTADGSGLLVGSEGVGSTVYRVGLPWVHDRAASPSASASAAPSPILTSGGSAASHDVSPPRALLYIAIVAGGFIVIAVAAILIRRRAR
jgi:hypothetical protein